MKEELERGKISKVGRQTLAQKCYEQIKQSILQGDIAPGERLQEVRMANLLNVSPAPVREAFRMLATEGLIRILPWKGAVVRGYSSKEILDVVQCRVALETLAMRLAYANMGEELTRSWSRPGTTRMSARWSTSTRTCTSSGLRAAETQS